MKKSTMNKQQKYRTALQNRSIKPSEGSWDQLSKKMDAHENVKKGNKGLFLKYAAVILVLISIGFYFLKPVKDVVNEPIIVVPTVKEDIKKMPIINEETEVRVAESPKDKEVKEQPKQQPIVHPKNNNIQSEALALSKTKKQLPPLKIANIEAEMVEVPAKEILIVEASLKYQDVDAEVEQLLNTSKIKLIINRQISSKRAVSAHALLAEVEDDLDKDFKEKLFEKIVNTVKQPRKVVITDRGN